MICPNCKKRISKDDKFCPYCGQKIMEEKVEEKPEPTNTFSFKQPISRLLLLYVFTFGLYGIYWFYKTWKQIKEHTKATFSPGWRTVGLFIPIYNIWRIYTLFDDVKSLRIKAGFTENPSPGWLTLGYIVLGGLSRLPDPWYLLGFLSVFPLLSIQKALNEYWEKEQRDRKEKIKFSTKEIIILIIGAIFLALSLWGTFISESDYKYPFEEFLFSDKESSFIIGALQEKLFLQSPTFQLLLEEKDKIQDLSKEIPIKTATNERKTAEQIFEKYSEAIVTVGIEDWYGDFGFGSGFLISPTGLIVTNYHVIEDADKAIIALVDKNKKVDIYNITSVVATDFIKDIAILKIKGQGLPYVTIGDSDLAKPGQKVFAIGNPEGFTNTISDGIISQIRELEGGTKSFQITVPISMGSSGGALFNEMGEVIGITNMIFWEGQNINFAVPINYVKELIGLKERVSESVSEEVSNLIFCNGQYWQPCPIGQKFHCPKRGDPFCCPGTILNDECCTGIVCNNKCWSPCEIGYKFYCPSEGDPYCQ